MHLVERYALACGVKIDKPFIFTKYFPFTPERYITVHSTSKDAKNYSFMQEVIDILQPILKQNGIEILQIGGKDDKPISNIFSAIGQTTINQTAYLIEHSMLHLGVDSFPVHIASYFNKPIVALYSNNHVGCVKPYWGDEDKHILLEPDRSKRKPSFSLNENPKSINEIMPEKIVESVCKLLNLPFDYPYVTVSMGENYDTNIIEMVPNQLVDVRQFRTDSIAVRMDFEFNEDVLFNQLRTSKCTIVTDKPINPNVFAQQRPNVIELHYEVTENNNPNFIKFLINLGVKVTLFSFLPEQELNKHKANYMDFGIIYPQPNSQLEKENLSELFYRSSKYTLSNNKIYPSRHAWLNNVSVPTIGNHLVSLKDNWNKHTEMLWRERRHMRFVKSK